MNANDREKQIAEAEEILGDRLERGSFVKGLFFGQYLGQHLHRYPLHPSPETLELQQRLRDYCGQSVDPVQIDRRAEIPTEVIRGLGELGVLGACLPKWGGGLGWNQTSYCRLLEVLGGHCGSTALFVNAHHSIGPRALVLFGTQKQQEAWLPKLASGEWISAFALTEPEAGSDAGNVQSQATPSADGQTYTINGQKRWITNGGIADVLTLMARTPVDGSQETKVTAFIVTPQMKGFKVVEKRMEKLGVRGTATARLEFRNMSVPSENILGRPGMGLRVALTVLDFGRTTFGASCTGAAKYCVAKALEHTQQRVQFGKRLCEFEMVQDKLAYMQSGAYAMEACTYQTAALIDSGSGEFMLETAMLKVFSTEVLWRIINDTFQLYGGKAYFNDEPFERMLRDARINQIGEGANDVLRGFTALVGMRDVGLELESILHSIFRPAGNISRIFRFAGRKLGSLLTSPPVDVSNTALDPDAEALSYLIGKFGAAVERLLRTYQQDIVDRQLQLGRAADIATELYVSSCVLNRLDAMLRDPRMAEDAQQYELLTGRYYLQTARRRIRSHLKAMWENDDDLTLGLAASMLRRQKREPDE